MKGVEIIQENTSNIYVKLRGLHYKCEVWLSLPHQLKTATSTVSLAIITSTRRNKKKENSVQNEFGVYLLIVFRIVHAGFTQNYHSLMLGCTPQQKHLTTQNVKPINLFYNFECDVEIQTNIYAKDINCMTFKNVYPVSWNLTVI